MARDPRPSTVRVRMYQVGFGDCFLITVEYSKPLADGRRERHMLVDFGSTNGPKGGRPKLSQVAAQIVDHTKDTLDVLVVTHRHEDHLGAFGQTGLAEHIDKLAPRLIVRPWTDDPAAGSDARAPQVRLGPRSLAFMGGLRASERTMEALEESVRRVAGPRSGIRRAATAQIPNRAAVAKLERWAASSEFSPWYVCADEELDFSAVIPGVSAHVLGPPTLEQVPNLNSEANKHPDYWLRATAGLAAVLTPNQRGRHRDPLELFADPDRVGVARWLIERLDEQDALGLFRIVRLFDEYLNNTSVILLLRIGDRSLLLSGDAQIENWSYTLSLLHRRSALRAALSEIDLYKVGHHGSRNATPKTLFALWENERRTRRPLMTLMSTLPNVHGESRATKVPQRRLTDALEANTNLLRTDTLAVGDVWIECEAPCQGTGGFRHKPLAT